MRFPEEFLNELKSRVRLSDVVGRKVQLKKRGKDYVGLSPFSNEKTASFYVHDDRGFYKCFSTQKSGDAITFLMETERLTFAEAVEKLAQDAGLELPRQSEGDVQQYKKRTTLLDWAAKACAFYEKQLVRPVGREAREYLKSRGFGEEAWARHRMGFAPDGWRNLADELIKQGATVDELVEAGLVVRPEDDDSEAGDDAKSGGKKERFWDRFRNRVIFPIADPGGRIIAFGARTLDPNGKPKYLNSSDSQLFHKGKTLYRYMPAREALAALNGLKAEDTPLARGLIVTEGYVDAIALAEAGIGTAVAPLGTALTEDQLELLWRAGPEPILCFDGDAAGLNAAYRGLDRALPLIEPGKTLFFVLLPDGMDPDDVVRVRGAQAMRDMLTSAKALVDLLWSRELETEPLDTPERKAGFEARLMAAVSQIKHPGVKKAYERELRDRLYWHSRQTRGGASQAGNTGGQKSWSGSGSGSGQGQNRNWGRNQPETIGVKVDNPGRTGMTGERLVVRAIESPGIMELVREALTRAAFEDPDVVAIRDAAFYVYDHTEMLDRPAVAAHLRSLGRKRAVELLETFPVGQPMDPRSAEGRDWLDALGRFPVAKALVGEVKATVRADEEGVEMMSAAHQARIMQKVIARRSASRSVVEETAASPSDQGVQELRDAVGGMGAAMENKRSED